MKKSLFILFILCCCSSTLFGAIVEHIGTGLDWNVDWIPISGLNDANDSVSDGYLDFVGDSSDAGAYWADNGTYVFFRMRVAHTGAAPLGSFSGSHLLLIDVDGYTYPTTTGSNTNGALPDFAFSWDSKSNDPDKHGLEFSVLSARDNVWNGINMDDIDGSAGQKLANDINGDSRTGDGYVRTVDGQSTANLGTTTFIDYAVSWNYLETYTLLTSNQTWNISLASIADATDHNNFNADIGGGASLNDQTTIGWAPAAAVPEPTVIGLLAVSGLTLLIGRRIRND